MNLRVLNVLGQRPDGTGSGIFLREMTRAAHLAGDEAPLICAGYPDDDFKPALPGEVSVLRFSATQTDADVPHLIPGMSDVMPYPSMRYSELGPTGALFLLHAYCKLLHARIKALRPDVIHLHHLWIMASLAARFPSQPWVVTLHGTELKQWISCSQHRHLVSEGMACFRHFFCVSRGVADDAIRILDLPPESVSVLGNGFNPAVFHPHGEPCVDPTPVVLCAGKFVGWKGFTFALRASAKIPMPHRLVILGTGHPDSRRGLEEEAKRLGIGERVLFPGHLPQVEVSDWMRRASVFVLPSLNEPFGLVMLEAMACGCPVIAAASGGPLDVITGSIRDSELGTLVPPHTGKAMRTDDDRYASDLAAAIVRRLAQPFSAQERAQRAALVSGMTWAHVYDTQRRIYRRILDDCRGTSGHRPDPGRVES